MGAAKKIKMILIDQGKSIADLARERGELVQTFYNKLQRDTLRYSEVEDIASSLGCEILFRDSNDKFY